MDYSFKTQTGECDLEAEVKIVGEDLLVAIWGGERPHIGAVAMAQPRPSLDDPEKTSATSSVFTYLGHKEDMLVKPASEALASALKKKVVLTAGIHWDDIEKGSIERVKENCSLLVGMILEALLSQGDPVHQSRGAE